MLVSAFYFCLCAHHDASSTCFISIFYTLQSVDVSARRKVWRRYVLHQFIDCYIGIVYVSTAPIYYFVQVMGRYIRRHAHGNTIASVYKQVWNLGRHHGGLLQRVVEVVHHIHRIFLNVVHYVLAHLCQAALCVTHSCWWVAIDRTKVSLSVHKLVAHVPFLSHAYQCAIDRRIAMWVVFSEHLSYDTCTLLIGLITKVAYAAHTVENTTVHRLKTIAYIRKRTSHNHRHGIVDVRTLHLLLNVYLQDAILVYCLIFVHYYLYFYLLLLLFNNLLKSKENCFKRHLFSF